MKSRSVCNFIASENTYSSAIRTVNFVYETEIHSLQQPFFRTIYYMHIVTKGTAELRIGEARHPLKTGDVFFIFPGFFYTVDADEAFEYAYISFMGTAFPAMLEERGITRDACVYGGFTHLIDFWLDAVRRADVSNVNILTESVLLHTLSYIGKPGAKAPDKNAFVEQVVRYIDEHFTETDMSLKKIAREFSYTENYLSHRIKKSLSVSFSTYLARIRIQYAIELIGRGVSEIASLSTRCGYADAMYFSKVFRKQTGFSPSGYIRLVHEDKNSR